MAILCQGKENILQTAYASLRHSPIFKLTIWPRYISFPSPWDRPPSTAFSQPTTPETPAHHAAKLFLWQILVEHGQIVAEIEKRFPRITLLQRGAPNVPHLALRDAHNASAASAQAPAEVNFFLMGKEAAVESARCTPVFSANHQSRPCGPQHVGDVVILPFIVFNVGKDASAAVRITIDVKETSRN